MRLELTAPHFLNRERAASEGDDSHKFFHLNALQAVIGLLIFTRIISSTPQVKTMRSSSGLLAAAIAAGLVSSPAFAAESPSQEQLEFFESKIRPVLAKNCYGCHSAEYKTRMGGLSVDTKAGLLSGGSRGEAIVPGDAEGSLLIQALRQADKLKMPPQGKLPDGVIADFEQWVKMGAPDPREGKQQVASAIDIEKGREFWAFQAPHKRAAPQVKDLEWPRGAVDQFVLAKLEEKGLEPVTDADRGALLRRVTFDLVGLPPTAEELQAFVEDPASTPDAYKKVVNRLLDSPRFGERWARHWFDVARYAETVGRTRNAPFPLAWRYRDYVIDSLNADKPYDQFIREQVAGDLLPYDSAAQRREQIVATGFLALGAHDLNEPDRKLFPMDVADEMINVTSRSFLALTVGCARCHDHKFDPIPTKDYYAMAGIFRSTELMAGMRQRPIFNAVYFHRERLIELDGLPAYDGQNAAELEAKRAELWVQLNQAEKDRNRAEVRRLAGELDKLPIPQNLAMGVMDAREPETCHVNIGGDPHELGEEAPRGYVQALYEPDAGLPAIPKNGSGRLQLAEWLTREDNPLTARVLANRVWHHMFGRGIVKTVDNFGKMGEAPTHPELLDYLAVQLMEHGWSLKSLIREVALSRAYQLSTDFDARNFEAEPANDYYWRANRRRLEAEALRDAVLRISGEITFDRPEASPVYKFEPNRLVQLNNKHVEPWETESTLRSVYVPIVRNMVSRFYETFDFPEPSETHGAREVTTVAPQALFLMNNDFMARNALVAAERLIAKTESAEERVRRAYLQTLSREPTAKELESALKFVEAASASYVEPAPTEQETAEPARGPKARKMQKRRAAAEAATATPAPANATQAAWARLYHALLNSAEFRYRG